VPRRCDEVLQQEDALEGSLRRFAVVIVALAGLAPSVASAQQIPAPWVQQDQNGITITPIPGITIRLPGNLRNVPREPMPGQAPQWQPQAEPQPQWQPQPQMPEPEIVAPMPNGEQGRAVGVFVGISDYPTAGDLDYCASDAARVQQAFVNAGVMDPMDTIVLTDRQATRVAVSNALDRMMRRIGPNDTLVFFFSGHGNQVQDNDGDELDGTDETIVLYDGAVSDDELTRLLAQGEQRELVALDSCYSGGFSRDIARLSDSAGFYASREDQLSYVASEHQAGGYLSYHFAESISRSQGRPLTMWEIQRDLAEGFQRSNTSGRQDLTVGVSRGVNPQTVLFSRDDQNLQVASARYRNVF
jgi:hypothetical protein